MGHSTKPSAKNGAKIHKSNIARDPDLKGGGGAAKAIIVVFVILLALAAAILIFNKFGGCAMCKNISNYKETYDELSGTDTQDITSEDDYGSADGDYGSASVSSGSDKDESKIDNSSDAGILDIASVLDIFKGCGGKTDQEADNNASERIVSVSPTDIGQFELWEQPENDAAYKKMMSEKIDEYITLFTRLNDMRDSLSECKNAGQVEANERYASLKADLLNWCGGAQSFSAVTLGDECREAVELTNQVAADTRNYLSIYPIMVSTGDGEEQAKELVYGNEETGYVGILDKLQQISSIITASDQQ